MKIEQVFEYDIDKELETKLQDLLSSCFPKVYPSDRIYFKQLPHFRFLAYNHNNQLVGQVGLDYRVMNLGGEPMRILGIIDLCVSHQARSAGIGTSLLLEVDKFSVERNIDFILLFSDHMALYEKNGYTTVENQCTWMKIDHESQTTKEIGCESLNELMIKNVGNKEWNKGALDLLGYLY